MTPTLSKGFYNAGDALDIKQGYIVYPGQERFHYAKNIEVLSYNWKVIPAEVL